MTAEPTVPDWLIEASKNFAQDCIPVSRMPSAFGPVQISPLGLVAAAYLAGWRAARDDIATADGTPELKA